jgi:hypothetical protein
VNLFTVYRRHICTAVSVRLHVCTAVFAFTVWTAVKCVHRRLSSAYTYVPRGPVFMRFFTVWPPSCVYRRLCVFTRVYRRLYAFTMWTAVFLCFSSHTLIRKYEKLSCYPTSPLTLSFLICRFLCPVAYSSSKVSTELVKASL